MEKPIWESSESWSNGGDMGISCGYMVLMGFNGDFMVTFHGINPLVN